MSTARYPTFPGFGSARTGSRALTGVAIQG